MQSMPANFVQKQGEFQIRSSGHFWCHFGHQPGAGKGHWISGSTCRTRTCKHTAVLCAIPNTSVCVDEGIMNGEHSEERTGHRTPPFSARNKVSFKSGQDRQFLRAGKVHGLPVRPAALALYHFAGTVQSISLVRRQRTSEECNRPQPFSTRNQVSFKSGW